MKKILALLLALTMVLSMAACKKKKDKTPAGDTTQSSASTRETSTTETGENTDGSTESTTENTETTGGSTAADPDHTHKFTEKSVTKATCTEPGTKMFACTCGDTRSEKIPATGHTWSNWKIVKAPTEKAQGLNQRACATCKTTETLPTAKIPAGHTHSYKETVVQKADCLHQGENKYTCSCGLFYTEFVPKGGHNHTGTETKKATCTAEGLMTYTCICGDTYTQKIPASGHIWSDWKTTKEPTTTAEGVAQRTCSACKTAETKAIAKLPAPEPEQITVTEAQLQKIKDEFLRLVNLEREKVGVDKLTLNTQLDAGAKTRSGEVMASFSHTRPDGSSFDTVIDQTAYPYTVLGENLCMTSHVGDGAYTAADKWVGSDTQIEAAAAWMFTSFKNSAGHYANMIKEEYTECGIGISYKMENDAIPMFYTAHIFGAR